MPPNPLLLAPLDYNSMAETTTDSKLELLPLHSPLLRQSSLISFPPLSNMLKFSGCSCLISDTEFEDKISSTCIQVINFTPIEITQESDQFDEGVKDPHVHL